MHTSELSDSSETSEDDEDVGKFESSAERTSLIIACMRPSWVRDSIAAISILTFKKKKNSETGCPKRCKIFFLARVLV